MDADVCAYGKPLAEAVRECASVVHDLQLHVADERIDPVDFALRVEPDVTRSQERSARLETRLKIRQLVAVGGDGPSVCRIDERHERGARGRVLEFGILQGADRVEPDATRRAERHPAVGDEVSEIPAARLE